MVQLSGLEPEIGPEVGRKFTVVINELPDLTLELSVPQQQERLYLGWGEAPSSPSGGWSFSSLTSPLVKVINALDLSPSNQS